VFGEPPFRDRAFHGWRPLQEAGQFTARCVRQSAYRVELGQSQTRAADPRTREFQMIDCFPRIALASEQDDAQQEIGLSAGMIQFERGPSFAFGLRKPPRQAIRVGEVRMMGGFAWHEMDRFFQLWNCKIRPPSSEIFRPNRLCTYQDAPGNAARSISMALA